MDKAVGLKLAQILVNAEGMEYIEALTAFAAAPTIKGVKPSTLMRFASCGKNTMELWQTYGREICLKYDLESFELRKTSTGILLLLYKKNLLNHYLTQNRNRYFLEKMGYETVGELSEKLIFLKSRFEQMCPHEVGLFLGIPIEDVEGFIQNKGQNCLLCRYWKVYGSEKKAKLLFGAYDRARAGMMQLLCDGKNVVYSGVVA